MHVPDLNYLAIVVAGIVPMIVGALWYGPIFGKRWLVNSWKLRKRPSPRVSIR